jgi:hypothetical protein
MMATRDDRSMIGNVAFTAFYCFRCCADDTRVLLVDTLLCYRTTALAVVVIAHAPSMRVVLPARSTG